MMTRSSTVQSLALAVAIAVAVGCSSTEQQTDLEAPSKEGYVYLNFADAQREALAEDKLIMLYVRGPG